MNEQNLHPDDLPWAREMDHRFRRNRLLSRLREIEDDDITDVRLELTEDEIDSLNVRLDKIEKRLKFLEDRTWDER